jgi:hypothetical protein
MPVVLGRPLDFLLSLIDIAFFMIYCCHEMMAEASPTFPKPATERAMNAIVSFPPVSSCPSPGRTISPRAADLAREEKAGATRRVYRSDFRIFEAWRREGGFNALPAS